MNHYVVVWISLMNLLVFANAWEASTKTCSMVSVNLLAVTVSSSPPAWFVKKQAPIESINKAY